MKGSAPIAADVRNPEKLPTSECSQQKVGPHDEPSQCGVCGIEADKPSSANGDEWRVASLRLRSADSTLRNRVAQGEGDERVCLRHADGSTDMGPPALLLVAF